MRRMAPPPRLRVDQAAAPGCCRVGLGPQGLRLDAAEGSVCDGSPWTTVAMVVAGPVPCEGLDSAQNGELLVAWAPGLVRSVRSADAAQLFDRRPPGARAGVGAAAANAALVRDDAGWRAVVLPSLGDRLPDLGDGPVAISPDGLTVAVATADGAAVVAMADGAERERVAGGPVDALALGRDVTWVARGAAVGVAEVAHAEGAPVTILRAAAEAPVAAALHDDGQVTVIADGESRRWTAPVSAGSLAVSHDGAWVLVSGGDQAVVCRAGDGAVALRVAGVRCAAFAGNDRLAVAGEWGLAVIAPVSGGT